MKSSTAAPEFTIDELARQAGTTVRNVRAYQERGLLPPPEKRGRIGIYGEAHLARLKIIASLLGRGYTLANVAELIGTWEGGHDISKLLGLEAAITSPWSTRTAVELPKEEFLKIFGDALTPAALTKAIETGIVTDQGDTLRVSSMELVQAAALLTAEGVPLEDLLQIIAELRTALEHIAEGMMNLTTRYIFDRYGKDVLPPPEEVPRLADLIWRLRPMVVQIVDAEFARAMELATDKDLAQKLSMIIDRLRARN